ncbi:hypothetical protein [Allobranchiibius sp. CTAmp26]|uniref:hypothetical protein n=1 Tax=Allobranchiibius sp. CTAmp26 TaxID=2815214 RepID=UPI001AA140F5|nr:hypothetical protein [Allobranchiibius sp. CTAmp26]MBO1756904.1 hypothetical protein [Allobranchiibius sp. CTAmp26]
MSTAVLFSLVASALTAACSVPQLYLALRSTLGVSVSAWAQSFALGFTWASYGLATRQWVLLASEGAFALGSLAIASRLLSLRRTAGCTAGCVVVVIGAFAVFGPGPCVLAASLGSVTVRVAQIRGVVRSGTAGGVSISTWLVLAASNFAWTAAGVANSDTFFAWSAAFGGVSSLAVVATCAWYRRQPAFASREP